MLNWTKVIWGLNKDRELVKQYVTLSAPKEECINIQRYREKFINANDNNFTDEELLEAFKKELIENV